MHFEIVYLSFMEAWLKLLCVILFYDYDKEMAMWFLKVFLKPEDVGFTFLKKNYI